MRKSVYILFLIVFFISLFFFHYISFTKHPLTTRIICDRLHCGKLFFFVFFFLILFFVNCRSITDMIHIQTHHSLPLHTSIAPFSTHPHWNTVLSYRYKMRTHFSFLFVAFFLFSYVHPVYDTSFGNAWTECTSMSAQDSSPSIPPSSPPPHHQPPVSSLYSSPIPRTPIYNP